MRRRTSGNLDSWLTWQQGHYRPGMNFGGDSLPRVKRVARRMGLRDPGAPLILVGGTNGKGSVVAFLEALARAHGLRAGCYTSPWLLRYNESVRVAGRELPDAEIIASFERVEAARRGAAITAFEARALAAAWAIRASEPELAVMEVGLGGRLDAVNVFHAAVAVIASIGLDHCEILGETLEQIAREKAGIMRRGRAAISADPASNRWLRPLAGEAGALFHGAQEQYRFGTQPGGWWLRVAGRHLDALPLPSLLGEHQIANAAGAIAAFALAPVPRLELEPQAVAAAMHDVRLRGRLEPLPGPGRRWVDVAHNPGAASALARWLSTSSPPGPLHAVCAMRAGKALPWLMLWRSSSSRPSSPYSQAPSVNRRGGRPSLALTKNGANKIRKQSR